MQFNKKDKILIIAAHPDDEVLGCGGTILKAKEAGATVAVLFLGEGISARFPIDKYDSQKFKDQTLQRIKESHRALEILKIDQFQTIQKQSRK